MRNSAGNVEAPQGTESNINLLSIGCHDWWPVGIIGVVDGKTAETESNTLPAGPPPVKTE